MNEAKTERNVIDRLEDAVGFCGRVYHGQEAQRGEDAEPSSLMIAALATKTTLRLIQRHWKDEAALQQENAELRKALEPLAGCARYLKGMPINGGLWVHQNNKLGNYTLAVAHALRAAELLARHPAPRSDDSQFPPADIEDMTFSEMRAELSAAGLPIDEHLNWTGLAEAVVKLRAK